MSEVRRLAVADLRLVITDAGELAKGTEIADKGALAHLSRHENKLFADAAGSGAAPYKTQLVFADGNKITGRCSCMAARSRPYCKHAAALLVSWARSPEAFAVADAGPAGTPGERPARSAAVKKGKVNPKDLQKRGIDQAFTLLSELWQTGVVAIAGDRAGQVRDLAASLRELGLRRLSARTRDLAVLLESAARRDGSFSAEDYAELFSDMWLTVRKLEKHLAGEPLADEHVEELIGRTWTKKDRKPIDDLDLIEYAFLSRTTADDFILRESRMFDLASGEHYTEKQILPAMMAKRLPAKPSYRGRRLNGASGTLYPSFAPRRLELTPPNPLADLSAAAIAAAIERALPNMAKALAVLAERRRDPFAPPSVPALVRVDGVIAGADRVRLLNPEGGTLFLAGTRADEDALMTALTGLRVRALFGDLTLDGALPSLLALAVIGERGDSPVLVPLGGDDASARDEARAASQSSWAATARRAAVSGAATFLGEVRDDLARGFQDGVRNAASSRFLDPLASRMAELSLGKQADVLRQVARSTDPTSALDDFVKVHQVLGIALSRLAAPARVDLDALVRVPRMPSVAILRPRETLSPEAAVAMEARGELHRWERAYHVAVHFESLPPGALLEATDRLWGNGFAAPFVIAAAAADPDLATSNARQVLSDSPTRHVWRPATARLAKLTAIRVLAAVGTPQSMSHLRELRMDAIDPSLLAHARRTVSGAQLVGAALESVASLVLAAAAKEDRAAAISKLAQAASTESIPVIRAALRDRTVHVKKAAATALAALGDTDSLDTFVAWMEGDDHELAKLGAQAIGHLGDLRGAGPVLAALARGFSPNVVRETLELLGPWVLGPLLDLVEPTPDLAKRASVSSLVKTFPREPTAATLQAWIHAVAGDPAHLARRAVLALDMSSARKDILELMARWLREHHAAAFAGTDSDGRALKKKLTALEKKLTAKT